MVGVENGTIKSTMSWITDIWDARIVLFGRNRWMKVLWKYRKRKTKTASSAYVACVFVYSCVSSPSACSASSLRSETCVNLCYYFIIYLRARNVCCTFLMFELCLGWPVPTNQFSHRTAEQQRYVNEYYCANVTNDDFERQHWYAPQTFGVLRLTQELRFGAKLFKFSTLLISANLLIHH